MILSLLFFGLFMAGLFTGTGWFLLPLVHVFISLIFPLLLLGLLVALIVLLIKVIGQNENKGRQN
ncbi:hypothetical protein [Hungatella sp.]|uniref:hypothetical protein n=1 Tax=Hungatella sp. TaxID=2613924 RepID=UPI002A836198|nr:hypothetical protein [Hungatella sp.]